MWHLLVDKLHSLSIPETWWDILSIDFVVELPKLSRYDIVITVIDLVLKRVHFILTHTIVTAEGAARLFLHYVWKLHGLPRQVVLDRDL